MHSIMDKYFNSIANSQRTNDSMSIEMLRLFSLRNFPRNINISMVRLAGAGFYSTGNSTETKCFLCEVIYRDWISGDDPMHIHRHISPTCDLVANGNRQDTIGEELQNVRRQERLEVHPSNLNGLSTGNVTLHSNENVCSSNVLTNGQQNDDVSDITSSAIHFHHHDIVEDQPTVFSTREAQIHDSNTNSNKTPTSNCKNNSQNIFIKNNSTVCNHERGSSNNHEDIGIHTQIPRYINYAPLHVRISSYEGWPGYLNQTPGEMALAGFLFAGYNDYTRCFHCGGGLRNWEAGDDPWVEHARWFPQCGFLKQNKGQNFIQAVLKKHNTDPKSNGNCSYSHKQSQEYHTGTPDKNTTTVSASSLQVSRFNVQEQANNVTSQERSNRINTLGMQTVISTSNNSTTTASGVNISSSSVSTTNMRHNQQDILQTVVEMGFSGHQVVDAVNEIIRLNSGEGGTDVSATDIMNVLLKEDHQRTRQVSNVPETRTAEGIGGVSFDDTHLIFEENRQLQEQRQCKVCKEFDSTIAFLPCGHIVCCTDCAPAMRKCPICKTYVKGTVKTYLA
ncbi:inhibitor of apoptosis protein-like isoform X1 [Mytilus californianus]|uniref:inhibitor of apoptosis protein-like isoform X1 n=1 Tax=Mytilus californianus TaxID=6549 RepID=UPI002245F6FE|nr:inhibitor of apoptosis protein-like isoform X1 [Mytilus californianus]